MTAERSASDEGMPPEDGSGVRPKAKPDPLIGMLIGERYRILRVHEQGGMSVVYAAMYEAQQREVAIKVLDEASASDPQAIERFIKEARMASSLSHGHVVGVSDYGRLPSGRPYLVMPLIHGKDLATLIAEEGRMPAQRVAKLLEGVASALDAMHEQGLIHRDIKSENLMHVQGDDGTETVLVLDFGIAAAPDAEDLDDSSGTPDFMAPEALASQPVDHRADVYSLATVAFELLSGGLPFARADITELARAKTTQRPRTLSEAARTTFPPALEAVIARGLARDPNNRPRSAGKFVQALSVAAANAGAMLQAPWVKAMAARAAANAAAASAPPPAPEPPRQVRKRTLVGQPFVPPAAAPEPQEKRAEDKPRAPAPATLLEGQAWQPEELLARRKAQEAPQPVEVEQARPPEPIAEPIVASAPATPEPPEGSIIVDPSLFSLPPAPQQPLRFAPAPIDSMSPVSTELELELPRSATAVWMRRAGFGIAAALVVFAVVFWPRSNEPASKVEEQPVAASAPIAAPAPAAPVEAPPQAIEPVPAPAPAIEPEPAPEPAPIAAAPIVSAPEPQATKPRASKAAPRTRATREPAAPATAPAPRASAQALSERAVDAMLRGDFESALDQFKAANAASPRYAPAHRGKGLLLERMGRRQEAASAFKQYLRLQPNAPDAAKIKARLEALQ